ncbi:MAG: hypothetical protein AB7E79_13325 [Rhodospirillaceae bacterium]
MPISADILITPQPVVVPVPPSQPRPAVAPAAEREGAQNQRHASSRNQNGPLSFRAALSAATFAGVARAASASESLAAPDEGTGHAARETRIPSAAAIELTSAEARDLFTPPAAGDARKSRAPAFAAAASRYAAGYFAGSAFYARPGATLELTA